MATGSPEGPFGAVLWDGMPLHVRGIDDLFKAVGAVEAKLLDSIHHL